jgi:carbon storage regulator
MLVLTRKVGERVVIAGEIVVVVLEVNGQRIRLGVEAPPEVSIRRQEVSESQQPESPSQQLTQ